MADTPMTSAAGRYAPASASGAIKCRDCGSLIYDERVHDDFHDWIAQHQHITRREAQRRIDMAVPRD